METLTDMISKELFLSNSQLNLYKKRHCYHCFHRKCNQEVDNGYLKVILVSLFRVTGQFKEIVKRKPLMNMRTDILSVRSKNLNQFIFQADLFHIKFEGR